MKWPDGRKYEGGFKRGKREGEGVMIWKDGREYKGEWENGYQEGVGVFKFSTGKVREGIWMKGRVFRWDDEDEDIDKKSEIQRRKSLNKE